MTETPVPQGTTRISGMRTALMAAARTARLTQLRQLIRRDRRKPQSS